MRQVDTMKRKQFIKERGTRSPRKRHQIFQEFNSGMEEIIGRGGRAAV